MAYFEELGILQYFLLWIAVFLGFGAYRLGNKRKLKLPPGPRGLPIVGYLPFIGSNPHLELSKLSKTYGDIFSVYFGYTHTVVVTNAELAKEVLRNTTTANRPRGLFQLVPDRVGFTEKNGQEWLEQRRYSIMQLRNLGLGKTNWENLVKLAASDVVHVIIHSEGRPFDPFNSLAASISNNIVSLLTDHRLPMGDPNRDIIDQGIESFQMLYKQSGLIVHHPKLFKFLADIGLLNVREKMKNMAKMNKYIRQKIKELKENKESQSYVNKYLTEIDKNKSMNRENSFNEKCLIGNVQAFTLAGSDTTSISIIWLLLAMASFPKIQKKVHEEIDEVLGSYGSVDWVDRLKLPYCLATVKESQRWRTAIPLNILRSTNEDMVVNGYDIPKGSRIMGVLWAFHHDDKYWKDPNVFQPERFLSSDGKSIQEQEAYLPFSCGKRVCPGRSVAYIQIFHYFVSILQKFQVLPESENSLPDLEGILGLTLHPKRQNLRFVLR